MKEAQKECINNFQNKQNSRKALNKVEKKMKYLMKMKFVMFSLLLLYTMGMQIDWLNDVL